MIVTSVAKLERFFRAAAGLDIDKEDLRRYSEFIEHKTHDLLLRAQAIAKANGRDFIEPRDLPITKGLQECIRAFTLIEQQIDITLNSRDLPWPQLDLAYGEETAGELAKAAGGLSVALARSMKIMNPRLQNPQTIHWETAFQLFDLLL